MSTSDTLRWWAEQFRTRTNEFYTSHVLVADLNHGADEIERLESENAKLRELARFIMHQCNDGNPRCDECIGWNDGECVALLRMRELGIGVEE